MYVYMYTLGDCQWGAFGLRQGTRVCFARRALFFYFLLLHGANYIEPWCM